MDFYKTIILLFAFNNLPFYFWVYFLFQYAHKEGYDNFIIV